MVNMGNYRYIDNTRKANAVVNCFRDSIFRGIITQSSRQTVRGYNICAAQFGVAETKKATHFVSPLEPPARDFSFENYETSMPYELVKQMIEREYDLPTGQAIVQTELETLRLDSFMPETAISDFLPGLKCLTIETICFLSKLLQRLDIRNIK